MSSRTDSALSRRWGPLLLMTIAAAAILRFTGLESGLWYDEILTLVRSVRLPLSRIVTEFPGVNTHPLYSVLAHASASAFGESAWSIRFPACVFGIASVWMVFVLGTRLIGRVEAWAAAVILATSYHHIWFSQNARGYTLEGLLVLLSTFLLLRIRESGSSRDALFYSLTCVAGVYTHLTMVFVVIGQALAVVAESAIGRPKTSRHASLGLLCWAWAGAALASALLYAPFLTGLIAGLNAPAPRQTAKVATGAWAIAEAVRATLSGSGAVAAIAGGLLALAGFVSLARRARWPLAILLAPGAVTAIAFQLLGQPIRPRFFFFLSGAAAIAVGRGIGAVIGAISKHRQSASSEPSPTGVVIGALCLVAMSAPALARNYQLPKQDFDGAVRFLESEEAAGARIAAAGPACPPIKLYFAKTSWPCLVSAEDLRRFADDDSSRLLLYTLSDYIADSQLQQEVRTACPVVRVFPGTLGGGDVIVCAPARAGRDAAAAGTVSSLTRPRRPSE
jgi:mannosyltransferase